VGLQDKNTIQIPDDISKVGWYKYGAAPGSQGGSTVIVGHRDGSGPEPGAFYSLNRIKVGDSIEIHHSNYIKKTYIVKKILKIDKIKFYTIANKIFSLSGKPKLNLISCAGTYNKKWGGYKQNIIITAIPLTK
jgi:LPXTG-site transpeptidase (sortase) family protein